MRNSSFGRIRLLQFTTSFLDLEICFLLKNEFCGRKKCAQKNNNWCTQQLVDEHLESVVGKLSCKPAYSLSLWMIRMRHIGTSTRCSVLGFLLVSQTLTCRMEIV